MYFITSVRYDKMHEDGSTRKTTDKYILDAMTFTDAEAQTIEHVAPFISGDFTIKTSRKTQIQEIVNPHADHFWLVKTAFSTFDDRTGREKSTVMQMLIGADDFEEAYALFKAHMKEAYTCNDWSLQSLTLTDLSEVIPWEEPKETAKETPKNE